MDPHSAGRYVLYDVLAKGGMATVHYGRLLGSKGFARTVAIKRLHPHLASDPDQAARFLDEGRLGARVRHSNVVGIIDVISSEGEAYLVMDYIHGESLARLVALSSDSPVPLDIIGAILCGALEGLQAAHDAKGDDGKALHIVHRDFSPQNILVGADGVARVLDFGVAKASGRSRTTTTDGRVLGKLAYMAPEQLEGGDVDRRTDVFAAGVLLWEMLTGARLFGAGTQGETVTNVLRKKIDPPSSLRTELQPTVDLVVERALQRTASRRYPDARQMAHDLEACLGIASPTRVAKWMESLASDVLAERARAVEAIEARSAEEEGLLRDGVVSARIIAAEPMDRDSEVPNSALPTVNETPFANAGTSDWTRRRVALPALGLLALIVVGIAAWRLSSLRSRVDSPSILASQTVGPPGSSLPLEIASAHLLPAPDVTASTNASETAAPTTTAGSKLSSQRPQRSHRKPLSPPAASSVTTAAPVENPNAQY